MRRFSKGICVFMMLCMSVIGCSTVPPGSIVLKTSKVASICSEEDVDELVLACFRYINDDRSGLEELCTDEQYMDKTKDSMWCKLHKAEDN